MERWGWGRGGEGPANSRLLSWKSRGLLGVSHPRRLRRAAGPRDASSRVHTLPQPPSSGSPGEGAVHVRSGARFSDISRAARNLIFV